MSCNHAIGTAIVEYQKSVIHVGDSVENVHQHSFSRYTFCPYCGAEVVEEASKFEDEVDAKWEDFWKWYEEQHGPEETKRARSRP